MKVVDQYPVQIAWSEEDEGFIATVADLPGCSAYGRTQLESLTQARDAIAAWIDAATAAGNPVPQPSRPRILPPASGKALLRLPKGLHARLILDAEQEGSSFNTYCIALLAQNSTIAAVGRAIEQSLMPIARVSSPGSPRSSRGELASWTQGRRSRRP